MSNQKNQEIEVLRGVAVILVMLAHYPFLAPVREIYWLPVIQKFHFWAGVDIFFAISGYVVTRTILNLRTQPRREQADLLIRFWFRRFFRLIPMAWLTLLIAVLLSAFWNDRGVLKTPIGNITDAFFQLIYMSNWRAYWCSVNQSDFCGANTHFWSLSLEEQFYIALPLLIIFLRRKFWWLAVALIVVQFPLDRPLLSLFWVTRLDAMLWGVIIAVAEDNGVLSRIRPQFMNNTFLRRTLLPAIIILICWLVAGGHSRYSVGIVAILSGVLVWFASYKQGYLFKHADTFWRPIAWVGARSYGIYLLHVFCFLAVYELFYRIYGSNEALGDAEAVAVLSLGLAFTLIVSQITYTTFERPITDFGRRKAKQIKLPFQNGAQQTDGPIDPVKTNPVPATL
ncbi:acyltransferase [Brucella tritici]|uniref:Acyltransferase n=1 Tax=Brucella tritici TaxID=94626 RepID=A0A833CJQ7_9HYPH|nr:acyltransferase [Brucella tritici]KAB2663396.1 acyltransferase [Brucella tritici]